ncbi:5-methyltetrahydrofolate--homocysteine methyltransferase (plasmid) [Mesorhizobium loti]|nr:5-methyltetrahydrofolate--homocysteine methyltransferase [Mesorhizobium loti]
MLKKIIAEKWFAPRGVIGFWPANAVGDDIKLFTEEARSQELGTFFTLRQQLTKRDGKANVALSDFVAPSDSGKPDYIGGFIVTAGIEEVAIAERFEPANDDYSSIMVKALADRFAEAYAERMHEKDGMLAPITLWEHEADRLQRRAANARTDVEKVTLRRRIAEIAGGTKPSKAELRNAVRRSHAADAPKPYDAMRPAAPAPADHPARPKRRLPVEDW